MESQKREEAAKRNFKKSSISGKDGIFKEKWLSLIENKKYLKIDEIFPSIKETLYSLTKNYRLVLVSLRRARENLIWQLNYFSRILCNYANNGNWRVKYILIKKDSPPLGSFIIGDTEIDILAGKKLKMKTVALARGVRNKDFLNKLKPDYLLNNLRGVNKILGLIK